jgi:hypothetical protein
VVLLVVAGCSGPLVGAGDERADGETLTPVPVPDEVRGPDELAPGVTSEGVVDATRLARAHARVLANVSYTAHRNVTRRTRDGRLRSGTESVVRTTADRSRFRYTLTLRRDERRVIDRFADGGRIYERERQAGETTYALLRGPDSAPLAPRDASFGDVSNRRGIANLFSRFRFVVAERVDRNGTTNYRLATPEPQAVPPAYDVTGSALVDERGFVREYELSYRIVRGGEGGTQVTSVAVRVRFGDVGSTAVAEPAWYDEAVAATTGNATEADDGTGTGTGTETGEETGAGEESQTGEETEAGGGTEADEETEAGEGSQTGEETAAGEGTERAAGAETETATGAETKTDASEAS